MSAKLLIIFVVIVGTLRATGQPSALSNEQNHKLLTLASKLFELSPQFQYSLGTYKIKQNYQEIKDAEIYDNYYLANYLDSLNKKPLNPLFNYQVGMFYLKNDYPKTATMCFEKALEALDLSYFDQDSAQYYSYSGLFRTQLYDKDAYTDFEKALTINPSDSLAVNFYYMSLLLSGDIDKLREKCITQLESNAPYPYAYLLLLIMADAMERIQTITLILNENEENFKAYRDTSFEAFYHYDLIKKYARRYPRDNDVKNTILLGNVFLLSIKGTANCDRADYQDGFEYPKEESKRIQKLQQEIADNFRQKKLNDYSAYNALGYTYLMQNNYEQSIFYLNKANDDFPKRKLCDDFNPSDSYAGLNIVYWIARDTTKIIENMERKLENLGDDYMSSDDYLLLAQCYYHKGEFSRAEEYTVQAISKNPENFEALQLRAHLFFFLGNNTLLTDFLNQAQEVITSKNQAANFLLQYAIYKIYFGDMNSATELLSQARTIKGKGEWELGDTLEREFLSPQ